MLKTLKNAKHSRFKSFKFVFFSEYKYLHKKVKKKIESLLVYK